MRTRAALATLVVLLATACASTPLPTVTPAIATMPALVTLAPTLPPTPTLAPTPTQPPPITTAPTVASTPSPPVTPTPTAPPTQPPPTPTATATATATSTPTQSPTGTPVTGGPEFLGACLTMTNEPFGDFPRTLLLDLAFESSVKQSDIARLAVVMSGANDGQEAEATFAVSSSWQASLGYRTGTPVSSLGFESATVETPNGQVYDIQEAVKESIGRIPRRFGPGDSVGEVCGGF